MYTYAQDLLVYLKTWNEKVSALTWYVANVASRTGGSLTLSEKSALAHLSLWSDKLKALEFIAEHEPLFQQAQDRGILAGLTTWEQKLDYINVVNIFANDFSALDNLLIGLTPGVASQAAVDWLSSKNHAPMFKALLAKGVSIQNLLANSTTWTLSYSDKIAIAEGLLAQQKTPTSIRFSDPEDYSQNTDLTSRITTILNRCQDYQSLKGALVNQGYTDFSADLTTALGTSFTAEVNSFIPGDSSAYTRWIDFVGDYLPSSSFLTSENGTARIKPLVDLWKSRETLVRNTYGQHLLMNLTSSTDRREALTWGLSTPLHEPLFNMVYKLNLLANITKWSEKLQILIQVQAAEANGLWNIINSPLFFHENPAELKKALSDPQDQTPLILKAHKEGVLTAKTWITLKEILEKYTIAQEDGVLEVVRLLNITPQDAVKALNDYVEGKSLPSYSELTTHYQELAALLFANNTSETFLSSAKRAYHGDQDHLVWNFLLNCDAEDAH